jgi:hypothetical protein
MKNLDLSTLKVKDLVLINNAVSDDTKQVKGFKSAEVGMEIVTALLEEGTKGKANKARLQTGISKLPLAILAILAPAITFANDLAVRVYPAHRRILATMAELGMGEKPAHKNGLAKALGLKNDDAKFADVLGKLYSLNLITWDEAGVIGLLDTSINFVATNSDDFEKETPFSDLASEAPKAVRTPKEGGVSRSRIPKDAIIVPLFKENPCTPGKARHADYEKFIAKPGMTVGEYQAAGGVMFNLIDAVKRVRVELKVGKDGGVIPAIEQYEKWR